MRFVLHSELCLGQWSLQAHSNRHPVLRPLHDEQLALLFRRHARFIVDKHKTGSWHIRTLPFSTIWMETGTHPLVCRFDDVRLGNREIENRTEGTS